jgi:hypothetical protein
MKTETTKKTDVIAVNRDIYTAIDSVDLQDLLTDSAERGTTFVKMFTNTVPAMRKTNNPFFDNIIKSSQTVCMVGFDYENVVNNARAKEAFAMAVDYFAEQLDISKKEAKKYIESLLPKANSKVRDFQAKPRVWGNHINSILIDHTNKAGQYNVYIQVWVLHSQKPVYKYADNGKALEGKELDSMKSFLSKRSSNAGHQGLEKEVVIRDYNIGNIDKIHLNKQKYSIK